MESIEINLEIIEREGTDYCIPALYISPNLECNITILYGSRAQIQQITEHTIITYKNYKGCITVNGIEIVDNTIKECIVIINGPHEYSIDEWIDSR